MKKHIYFNLPDKPQNMGQSQLTDNITSFLEGREAILPNAKVEGNRLTFDVKIIEKVKDEDGREIEVDGTRRGFAMIADVEDDFQN